MMRTSIALTMLFAPLAARADAPPDATALFDQGIKDLEAGNTEQACKELAASLAQFNDSGTKGALAGCYTKLGKTVSAWNLWRDLADTAPTPDLKKDAAANAFTLEARLPRFVIRLKGAVAPGLTVAINGVAVADPTLAVPLPVDPGEFTVHASAPDYEGWTLAFQASEAKVTTVEVPPLKAAPKPKVVTPASAPNILVVREDTAGTRHSRHVIGLSMGVVGAAALGVGGYFGLQARSQWTDAKNTCGGSVTLCPTAMAGLAQNQVNDARTSALVSTLAMSVGAAVLITGVIVWFSAPSGDEPSALHVTPTVGAQSVGLTWSGTWR